MVNLYNNTANISANQDVYDSFNGFIFSQDRNVFNKLYSRMKFYEMTKHLLGDIVECGVFKGSGLLTWLKILDMNEPNSIKKVIGFDFFNPNFVDDLQDEVDRDLMKQVFDRCKELEKDELTVAGVRQKIKDAGFDDNKFDLVAGDISLTSRSFLKDKPGLRISVLYLDLDLGDPTYETLNNMWDRVVDGGIVVLDEYAYHGWSESKGVDRFVKEHGLQIIPTNVKTPTAYIVK
jgi:hypothetical protein